MAKDYSNPVVDLGMQNLGMFVQEQYAQRDADPEALDISIKTGIPAFIIQGIPKDVRGLGINKVREYLAAAPALAQNMALSSDYAAAFSQDLDKVANAEISITEPWKTAVSLAEPPDIDTPEYQALAKRGFGEEAKSLVKQNQIRHAYDIVTMDNDSLLKDLEDVYQWAVLKTGLGIESAKTERANMLRSSGNPERQKGLEAELQILSLAEKELVKRVAEGRMGEEDLQRVAEIVIRTDDYIRTQQGEASDKGAIDTAIKTIDSIKRQSPILSLMQDNNREEFVRRFNNIVAQRKYAIDAINNWAYYIPVASDVAAGIAVGGASLFGTGGGEVADIISQKVADTALPGTKRLRGYVNSALSSITTAAIGSAVGAPELAMALSTYNRTRAQALDAGMNEDQATLVALPYAVVEGAVTAAFQAAGKGGLETVFGKSAWRSATIDAMAKSSFLKTVITNFGHEVAEEVSTEVLQAIIDYKTGLDEGALDAGNLAERLFDTVIVTGLSVGIAHGIHSRGSDYMRQRREAAASQANLSRAVTSIQGTAASRNYQSLLHKVMTDANSPRGHAAIEDIRRMHADPETSSYLDRAGLSLQRLSELERRGSKRVEIDQGALVAYIGQANQSVASKVWGATVPYNHLREVDSKSEDHVDDSDLQERVRVREELSRIAQEFRAANPGAQTEAVMPLFSRLVRILQVTGNASEVLSGISVKGGESFASLVGRLDARGNSAAAAMGLSIRDDGTASVYVDDSAVINNTVKDGTQVYVNDKPGRTQVDVNAKNIVVVDGSPVLLSGASEGAGYTEVNGQDVTIFLGENADTSTVIHEVAHTFRAILKQYAPDIEQTIAKTFETEESYAVAFEQYIYRGIAPDISLRRPFSQMRAAMMAVYDNVKNFGDISDDVAAVFDLMLSEQNAMEKEMQFSVSESRVKTLIDNAKLGEAQAIESLNLLVDYLNQSMSENLAYDGRDLSKVASAVKDQANRVLDDTPEAKAAMDLSERGVLKQEAQKFGLKGLFFRKKQLSDGAKELDAIAKKHGFKSVQDMFKAASTFKKQRSQILRAEMVRIFQSDPTLSARAVQAFVQGKTASQFIALLMAQGEAGISRSEANRLANVRAQKLYLTLRGEDTMNAKKTLNSAASTLQRAFVALGRNNQKRAGELFLDAGRQFALARMKDSMRKEMDGTRKRLERYANNKSKSIPESHKKALRLISERFGIGRVPPSSEIEVEAASQFLNSIQDLHDNNNIRDWRDLPANELNDIIGTINAIVSDGKGEIRTFDNAEKMAVSVVGEQMADGLNNLKRDISGLPKWLQEGYNAVAKTWNNITKLATQTPYVAKALDGYKEGAMFRTFNLASSKASGVYHTMMSEINRRLAGAGNDVFSVLDTEVKRIDAMVEDVITKGDTRLALPEFEDSKIDGEAVIALAMNYGSEHGRKSAALGLGITEEKLSEIVGLVSEDGWNAIRKVWGELDKLWNPYSDAFRDINGYAAPRVYGDEVNITNYEGKELRFVGGYYPIIADGRDKGRSFTDEQSLILANDPSNIDAMLSGVRNQDRMKRRTAPSGVMPSLSLMVIPNHIDNMVRYIAFAGTAYTQAKLLMNPTLARGIIKNGGSPYALDMFKRHVGQQMARQKPQGTGSRWIVKSAQMSALYTMAGAGTFLSYARRIVNQLGAIPEIADTVGYRAYFSAASKLFSNPKMMSEIFEESWLLRDRFNGFEASVAEAISSLDAPGSKRTSFKKALKKISQFSMAPLAFSAALTEIPAYIAVRDAELAKGTPKDDAIALANAAIEWTQPVPANKFNQSEIEQSNQVIWKLFTTLQSWTIRHSNLVRYTGAKLLSDQTPRERARTFISLVNQALFAPVAMRILYVAGAMLAFGDDDEDKEIPVYDLAFDALSADVASIPFVSLLVSGTRDIAWAKGRKTTPRSVGARWLQVHYDFISNLYRFSSNIKDGGERKTDILYSLAEELSLITGTPVAIAYNTLSQIWEEEE